MSTDNEGEVSQLDSSLLNDTSQLHVNSKSFDQEGKYQRDVTIALKKIPIRSSV